MMAQERRLATWYFEDGSILRISLEGEADTLEAVEMAQTLLQVKRAEIESKKPMSLDEIQAQVAELQKPAEDEVGDDWLDIKLYAYATLSDGSTVSDGDEIEVRSPTGQVMTVRFDKSNLAWFDPTDNHPLPTLYTLKEFTHWRPKQKA